MSVYCGAHAEDVHEHHYVHVHYVLQIMLYIVCGLLVKAHGLRIERSRVPVPLAAEIYFSSGCTQPYPKN